MGKITFRRGIKVMARKMSNDYKNISSYISKVDFIRGTIYLFSLFSMNKIARTISEKHNDFDFNEENDLLSSRFPELHSSYKKLVSYSDKINLNEYLIQINKVYTKKEIDSNEILSWIYQYFKEDEEKEIFLKSLKKGVKISGKDLLTATQFFTEEYMIELIINNTLGDTNPLKVELKNLRVIDPACGSGNFLVYAFEYLFNLYKDHYDKDKIINDLLNYVLVGYDLDIEVAGIAKLNLFVKACKYGIPQKSTSIQIFGGSYDDSFGFLKFNEKEPLDLLMFEPWTNKLRNLNELIKKNDYMIIVTNPPFMGNRDMGKELNSYLKSNFLIAKGDLCSAFMIRCLKTLNHNEKLGLVSQTSWMFLKNFKELRKFFLESYYLQTCTDLGPNSFVDINGEKTNVALIIFTNKEANEKSEFYHLRTFSIEQKESLLKNGQIPKKDIFLIDQKEFLKNRNYEILYLLEGSLKSKFNYSKKYGEYANPMQGTSTGDNTRFIDYSWKRHDDSEWRLVSKGGGYSKWAGLNVYKVKWGKNAEYITSNKGSAIRNLDKIQNTQLVYSDTGTLGMNVRLLRDNQVFIASGPGIVIKSGDKYSHLAYLNSRVASFFIRVLSPKLTTSAGYIKNLPIKEKIINSSSLADLAKRCVNLKNNYLKKKIPNDEFVHEDYKVIENLNEYIEKSILEDLNLELERLKYEYEIENEIENSFDFGNEEKLLIRQIVGTCAYEIKSNDNKISLIELDKLVADSLNINCQYTKSKIKKAVLGCEGFLEEASFAFDTSPQEIFDLIRSNIEKMSKTKKKYLEDFLHKFVLYVIGFKNNNERKLLSLDFNNFSVKAKKVLSEINKQIFDIDASLSLEKWINERFESHNNDAFYGKSFIKLDRGSDKIIKSFKVTI